MKYQKLDGRNKISVNVLKVCLFVMHRMSAGSEFHATGLEKLKALSLNLVRRHGMTTNFGAEHAAERSPGCDSIDGSTMVCRCSGHVPTTIPYISLTSLYCTRQRIGSQWSWIRLSYEPGSDCCADAATDLAQMTQMKNDPMPDLWFTGDQFKGNFWVNSAMGQLTKPTKRFIPSESVNE